MRQDSAACRWPRAQWPKCSPQCRAVTSTGPSVLIRAVISVCDELAGGCLCVHTSRALAALVDPGAAVAWKLHCAQYRKHRCCTADPGHACGEALNSCLQARVKRLDSSIDGFSRLDVNMARALHGPMHGTTSRRLSLPAGSQGARRCASFSTVAGGDNQIAKPISPRQARAVSSMRASRQLGHRQHVQSELRRSARKGWTL